MLKRSAVLTLAVLAASLGAISPVWAATSVRPAQGPSGQPTATTSAGTPSRSSSQGDMSEMGDDSMPGMHHATPTSSQTAPIDDDEMAGMSHAGAHPSSAAPRPLGAVVGAFAAVNGSVLLAAGLMRRRDKRRTASSSHPTRSTT
jgi:hypothetical protein